MKRSRTNEIMAEADAFQARKDQARHVIDARCGWDITDYGAGRFDEIEEDATPLHLLVNDHRSWLG